MLSLSFTKICAFELIKKGSNYMNTLVLSVLICVVLKTISRPSHLNHLRYRLPNGPNRPEREFSCPLVGRPRPMLVYPRPFSLDGFVFTASFCAEFCTMLHNLHKAKFGTRPNGTLRTAITPTVASHYQTNLLYVSLM
jgi:hypothetical protein